LRFQYQCVTQILHIWLLLHHQPRSNTHLEERPNGARKQGTPLCLLLLKACSMSFASDCGSIRQNEPFPGSSCDRGTLMKYRFSDKLCLIEFCATEKYINNETLETREDNTQSPHNQYKISITTQTYVSWDSSISTVPTMPKRAVANTPSSLPNKIPWDFFLELQQSKHEILSLSDYNSTS
jgi:hypothetical protein